MFSFFFFNDTATTEIYTLSLHDALPILSGDGAAQIDAYLADEDIAFNGTNDLERIYVQQHLNLFRKDRKSTRLNSSHANISYAVFCLKKKTTYKYKKV